MKFSSQRYLLSGVRSIKKYPANVESKDPVKTPILTPSIY